MSEKKYIPVVFLSDTFFLGSGYNMYRCQGKFVKEQRTDIKNNVLGSCYVTVSREVRRGTANGYKNKMRVSSVRSGWRAGMEDVNERQLCRRGKTKSYRHV